jgi:hypothetical protein
MANPRHHYNFRPLLRRQQQQQQQEAEREIIMVLVKPSGMAKAFGTVLGPIEV